MTIANNIIVVTLFIVSVAIYSSLLVKLDIVRSDKNPILQRNIYLAVSVVFIALSVRAVLSGKVILNKFFIYTLVVVAIFMLINITLGVRKAKSYYKKFNIKEYNELLRIMECLNKLKRGSSENLDICKEEILYTRNERKLKELYSRQEIILTTIANLDYTEEELDKKIDKFKLANSL